MNKKVIIVVAAVVAVVVSFVSCKPKLNDKFTAKVPNVEAQRNVNMKSVDLYIDFSGSMRGYIDFAGVNGGKNAQNTLISTVADFLDNVEKEYSIKTSATCGVRKYNKDDFRRAMQNRTVFNGGETILHEFIAQMASKANEGTVAALVSDMVMSYGKKKLLGNGDVYYNKHHLDGLGSAIHGVLSGVQKKGLDVMLLQYYSDFNGDYYYNYTENIEGAGFYKKRLMKNRPFYILFVGKQEALKSLLANKCMRTPNKLLVSFELNENDLKNQSFNLTEDSQYWVKGSESKADKAGYWTSSKLEDKTTTFTVSCDSFKIPAYVETIELRGVSAEGEVTKVEYDEVKEFLTFKFTTQPFKKLRKMNEVNITIMASVSNWGKDVSMIDDVNKLDAEMAGKTWGLLKITDAIDNVYFGKSNRKNPIVGRFTFTLAKK